jgi:hypothetical protein
MKIIKKKFLSLLIILLFCSTKQHTFSLVEEQRGINFDPNTLFICINMLSAFILQFVKRMSWFIWLDSELTLVVQFPPQML